MCTFSRGFFIFGNTFNAGFWGFPQVRNPYKRLHGNGFFCATGWLQVFGGYVWLDAVRLCRYRAFPIALELNVILTRIIQRLQGTCWSVQICF